MKGTERNSEYITSENRLIGHSIFSCLTIPFLTFGCTKIFKRKIYTTVSQHERAVWFWSQGRKCHTQGRWSGSQCTAHSMALAATHHMCLARAHTGVPHRRDLHETLACVAVARPTAWTHPARGTRTERGQANGSSAPPSQGDREHAKPKSIARYGMNRINQ
jgi:hypothetical protein